jgi:hypothetical protein
MRLRHQLSIAKGTVDNLVWPDTNPMMFFWRLNRMEMRHAQAGESLQAKQEL